MPRTPFKKKILEFVNKQSKAKAWTEKTKRGYKNALLKIRRENPNLQGRKPSLFSRDEILEVTKDWEDLKPRGKRHYWCIFRQFLEWVGNTEIHRTNYHIPKEQNRSVKWLTPEESAACREAAEQLSLEHLVNFHLSRDLGLRRCGKRRLEWKKIDFLSEQLEVLGKGRKWRTLPFHPLTKDILMRWKKKVKEMVEKARAHNRRMGYNRTVEIPEKVVVYKRWGKVNPYSDTTADNRLKEIGERAGVDIEGHHTLRRTFARNLYNKDVKVKNIRDLLGHESMDQTLKYIGVQQTEMKNSLEKGWNKR